MPSVRFQESRHERVLRLHPFPGLMRYGKPVKHFILFLLMIVGVMAAIPVAGQELAIDDIEPGLQDLLREYREKCLGSGHKSPQCRDLLRRLLTAKDALWDLYRRKGCLKNPSADECHRIKRLIEEIEQTLGIGRRSAVSDRQGKAGTGQRGPVGGVEIDSTPRKIGQGGSEIKKLDDFVVAMRNTMLRYASRQGNTVIYASPGCSIDPDPKVLQRLQQIGVRIASSQEVEKLLQQWQGVCRQPQEVRVMGVPFGSHFAQVMVVADYDMKRLANGSVAVDSEGFSSLTGMRLALARQELEEGRSLSGPLRTLNRFWFSPGDTTFVEDKGIIVFKQVEIKLLTEQEFVSRRGEVKGSGKPDPLAAKFAQSFSTRYADIAKSKPIYAELENLFRFVALARVIRQQEAASEAGISLEYLLSRHPVARVPVERTLAGISHVGELEQRQQIPGGRREAHLWMPSCGGVTIDILMRKSDLIRDSSLRRLKDKVIRERPSAQAVTWEFRGAI